MSQDDVATFLRRHGLRLDRDLGQHFLRDEGVLKDIVDAAGVTSGDHVVEIGAGIGVLTKELVQRAKFVTAIEVDQRLIPLLRKYLLTYNLQPTTYNLVRGNALQEPMPDTPYKVVANIPYHITSPLLRHVFLESEVHPTSLTLLIQREVAEKICDLENAGMLTILVSLFGTPHIVRKVPPDAFIPPPKVDSAVLHIACFEEPQTDRETLDRIFTLTKVAFSHKRKMLRNTLDRDILVRAGIDPSRRPEHLSTSDWIRLAQATAPRGMQTP